LIPRLSTRATKASFRLKRTLPRSLSKVARKPASFREAASSELEDGSTLLPVRSDAEKTAPKHRHKPARPLARYAYLFG